MQTPHVTRSSCVQAYFLRFHSRLTLHYRFATLRVDFTHP